MNKVKESTECSSNSVSIDARRKSLITVLARVLARDLQLAPIVTKKPKEKKESDGEFPK